MNTNFYKLESTYTPIPSDASFFLHIHDEYEIFLFLEGDSKYVVEDKIYSLEPWDIIIIRKHEMHRVYHNHIVPYRRIVLWIDPQFFQVNKCEEYEFQFSKNAFMNGNKIPAKVVISNGLRDAFLRYQKYSENYTSSPDSPILKSIIIEILYLVNKSSSFFTSDPTKSTIRSVILYLNNHYTEDISLTVLAEKFFLSKYYLCRAFQKATGLTVHEYIQKKRLTRVQELRLDGLTIGEAATLSGFKSYSSFYRAYMNEFGISPQKDI